MSCGNPKASQSVSKSSYAPSDVRSSQCHHRAVSRESIQWSCTSHFHPYTWTIPPCMLSNDTKVRHKLTYETEDAAQATWLSRSQIIILRLAIGESSAYADNATCSLKLIVLSWTSDCVGDKAGQIPHHNFWPSASCCNSKKSCFSFPSQQIPSQFSLIILSLAMPRCKGVKVSTVLHRAKQGLRIHKIIHGLAHGRRRFYHFLTDLDNMGQRYTKLLYYP